jgi:hypothetical protein
MSFGFQTSRFVFCIRPFFDGGLRGIDRLLQFGLFTFSSSIRSRRFAIRFSGSVSKLNSFSALIRFCSFDRFASAFPATSFSERLLWRNEPRDPVSAEC